MRTPAKGGRKRTMAVTFYCLLITRRNSGPACIPSSRGPHTTVGLAQSPGGQQVSHAQPAASGAARVFTHGAGTALLRIVITHH
jgi:hypothetical protein